MKDYLFVTSSDSEGFNRRVQAAVALGYIPSAQPTVTALAAGCIFSVPMTRTVEIVTEPKCHGESNPRVLNLLKRMQPIMDNYGGHLNLFPDHSSSLEDRNGVIRRTFDNLTDLCSWVNGDFQ